LSPEKKASATHVSSHKSIPEGRSFPFACAGCDNQTMVLVPHAQRVPGGG
jgi:hypothetical protein